MATNPCSFQSFSSLPAELRVQIWRDALPVRAGPALHFYKPGCWIPRYLSESEPGYYPDNNDLNLELEFHYELLDRPQIEVPLVYVNHEARSVSLAWIREQGIETHFRDDRRRPVFVRPFDPSYDAIYVPLDRWHDFDREPHERLWQPDLHGKLVNMGPNLWRIAVPEALLQSGGDSLSDILDSYFSLRALFVVAGAQPDFAVDGDGIKVLRRWELENTQGRGLFWNAVHRRFDSDDGECLGKEELNRRIEEVGKAVTEPLTRYGSSFEIRPVIAVER